MDEQEITKLITENELTVKGFDKYGNMILERKNYINENEITSTHYWVTHNNEYGWTGDKI